MLFFTHDCACFLRLFLAAQKILEKNPKMAGFGSQKSARIEVDKYLTIF